MPKKLKIAQICPYDLNRPGGVKSHIFSLQKHLELRGHYVKVIGPKSIDSNHNDKDLIVFGGNRALNIGGTKIDINIALGSESRKLKKFLNDENFDIIHYHTIWNPLLPFQVRMKAKNAKHIATFHDTPKNKFIGKTLMPLAAAGIFKTLDKVISVSDSQSKYIRRFSSKEVVILPNGIDLENYQNMLVPKRNDDQIRLLFIGRLEPRKGIFHALNAYESLKPKYPKLHLTIVGDGDMSNVAKQFVADYKLPDVDFRGFIDEETKIRLLRSSDIFLAPAIYGESFGIVLLEAMAAGLPMVGYANEGYKNVLTPEMYPYFPVPEDQTGFTLSLENMITSSQKRAKLASIGLKEVKKYDWPIIADQIIALYEQALL